MKKRDPEICDAVLGVLGDVNLDFDELRKKAAEVRGPLAVEWLAMMHPDSVPELERIDSPSDGDWRWVPGFVAKAIHSMEGLVSVEIKSDSTDYEVHGLMT